MIVLDASAVIEILLQTQAGAPVARRLLTPNASLHAPQLLDIEVAQVLRRFVARGALSETRAAQALEDLRDLSVERYGHEILLPRVWALRHNLTAYDATYVALAEALGGMLLTRDSRISRAAGHSVQVDVF